MSERRWIFLRQRRILLRMSALLIGLLAAISFLGESAQAVPAFARKYDVTCNACHTRQPRLNAYGQRFLENGYQLPGTEDGGTTMKDLFGGPLHGVTLDDISNFMAVRFRGDVQKAEFREPTEATDDVEFVFPNVINLFFAGTATENIGFFIEGEYAPGEHEGAALIFERALLVFSNIASNSLGHQALNFKIGEFDPSSMYSFPTHRQQLNPIFPNAHTEDFPPEINRIPLLPLAFSSKMFGLTNGPETVGEEEFSILPFEPFLFNSPAETGATVYGRLFGERFLYQVGTTQHETAEDEPDTRWDSYFMLRYDLLQGDYSALQVSGFYYVAPDAARATLSPAGVPVFSTNTLDWTRWGVGARWQHKFLDVYGTIILDEIDAPIFAGPAAASDWETDAMGISLEADWLFTHNWLLGLRYDYMDSGGLVRLPPPLQGTDPQINQKASLVGLIAKYYPAPNVALYGRAHINLESSVALPAALGGDQHPARNLTSMVTVGVDMAF
ncbi:MAG: hypothetical protein ACE5OQ_14000 [Woeseia sp.]